MPNPQPIEPDSELYDEIWDELATRFNNQPRPNDYVDDAGYDEAAATFLNELTILLLAREQAAVATEVNKALDDVHTRLSTFTAEHDAPMRDEALSAIDQVRKRYPRKEEG